MTEEKIKSSNDWIKYVIGGALIVAGIGLLFLDKTQIVGYIILGIGIGKII